MARHGGRAVWSLALISLELRILLAALVLLVAAYRFRLIDELLRLFFIHNLEGKFKLPIRIGSAALDVKAGTLELRDVHMLAPPRDSDPRWHYPELMSAQRVRIVCDPVLFAYFFVVSYGKVISAVGVYVEGVQFYLESYEAPMAPGAEGQGRMRRVRHRVSSRKQPARAGAGGVASPISTVLFNFKLIGGEVKKRLRRRKPTLKDIKLREKGQRMQQLRQRGPRGSEDRSGSAPPSAARGQAIPAVVSTSVPVSRLTPNALAAAAANSNSNSHSKTSSPVRSQTSLPPTPEPPNGDRKPMRASLLGMVSKANSYMREAETKGGLLHHASNSLSRMVTDYNSEVQSAGGLLAHAKSKAHGVMHATAAKLDTAYQSAKERIRVSYEHKIMEFHERLRGGEPIPDSRDGYLHLVELVVTDIEVHLRNVLPQRLRPLEKTSFLVPELVAEPAEFKSTHLLIDPRDSVGRRRQAEEAVRAAARAADLAAKSKGGTPDGKGTPGGRATPGGVSSPCKVSSGEAAAQYKQTAQTLCDKLNHQVSLGAAVGEESGLEREFSWLNAMAEAAHWAHQAALDMVEAVLHFPVEQTRVRALGLVTTAHRELDGMPGLPICVLIYRLERMLLSEMLKDNASRVLNDAVSEWWVGGHKQRVAGPPVAAAVAVGAGSAAVSPAGAPTLRAASVPPPMPTASHIKTAALEHREAGSTDRGGYVDEDSFFEDGGVGGPYDDEDSVGSDGGYYYEDGDDSEAESSGSDEERNLRMVLDDMLMP